MEETPYIDIHSHINFVAFDDDRDFVVKRMLGKNVYSIVVGTNSDSSKKAIDLANKYPKGVFACVGIHPIHSDASFHDVQELGEGNKEFTSKGEKFDKNIYLGMTENKKVVAIGECGLDYYRIEPEKKKKQLDNFLAQIDLANEKNLPLMLHVRKSEDSTVRSAYLDVADILKKESKTKAHFHFFAGNIEEARVLLDLGATLSFTGVITFAKQYEEVVMFTPNDRIMSETDCPYVAPVPHRGKRNEPVFVIEVVNKMAQIKGISTEKMKEHIWQNAVSVFGVEK